MTQLDFNPSSVDVDGIDEHLAALADVLMAAKRLNALRLALWYPSPGNGQRDTDEATVAKCARGRSRRVELVRRLLTPGDHLCNLARLDLHMTAQEFVATAELIADSARYG